MAWRKVTDDHTDIIISPQIARQGKLLRFLRSASLHFFVAFLPIFSTDPDPKTIEIILEPNHGSEKPKARDRRRLTPGVSKEGSKFHLGKNKNKENDFDYLLYMDEQKQVVPVEEPDLEDVPL